MAIKFLSTVLSALTGKSVRNAELEAQRILGEAEEQKRRLLLEGREEVLKLRSTAEVDVKERLGEVRQQERRQQQKEEGLEFNQAAMMTSRLRPTTQIQFEKLPAITDFFAKKKIN